MKIFTTPPPPFFFWTGNVGAVGVINYIALVCDKIKRVWMQFFFIYFYLGIFGFALEVQLCDFVLVKTMCRAVIATVC